MGLFGRPSERDNHRAAAYARWAQERNPCAIASAVLGVFSLIEMGVLLVFGIAGMALGIAALRQLNASNPSHPHGQGLAWFGIVSSVVSLIIAAVLYLQPLLHR